jgi:hypothetical protein
MTDPGQLRPEQTTDPPEVLWVEQLSQEMLLTVQAFQLLSLALEGKMVS